MLCPECGEETSELHRSVNLGGFGILELVVMVCHECDWITVHDFNLIKQLSFENKEEVK